MTTTRKPTDKLLHHLCEMSYREASGALELWRSGECPDEAPLVAGLEGIKLHMQRALDKLEDIDPEPRNKVLEHKLRYGDDPTQED